MNLFNAHIHYLVSREYPTMIYRLTCVHNILIFNFKMNEFISKLLIIFYHFNIDY